MSAYLAPPPVTPSGTPHPRLGGPAPLRAGALLSLARPGQWTKNLLVLAVPAAAGVLDRPAVLGRSLLLVLAFIAASSAVYAANDVQDAAADRHHPRKCARPVAAGLVSPREGMVLAAGCALGSLALGAALGRMTLLTLATYLLLSAAYTVRLKQVAVVDVVAVAVGFVLRSLAGAAAIHLPVSNWFLLVALFGALYLVAGKRIAELAHVSPFADLRTRPVLAGYNTVWLQQVLTLALSATVISYAMWAFQFLGTDVSQPLLAVSVLPFLVAMLRYGLLVSQGHGERPERLIMRDRTLLIAGVTWALIVGAGLYLA